MAQYDLIQYNPFIELISGEKDSDKFYDNDSLDFADSLQNISDILSDCRSYSKGDFTETVNNIQNTSQVSFYRDIYGIRVYILYLFVLFF